MPGLSYPTQEVIDTWNVREYGCKDGSSPTEQFQVDDSGADRVFRVKWEFRADFIKYMIGYAEEWDDSGTFRLSRLTPRVHPDFPGLAATRVTRVKGHKWTGNKVTTPPDAGYQADESRHHKHPLYQWTDEQANEYQDAEIYIHYDHINYVLAEDAPTYAEGGPSGGEYFRYISVGDFDGSTEYLQLPGGCMKYTDPDDGPAHGVSIPFNVGKTLSQESFSLIWERVPENVFAAGSTLYRWVYGYPPDDILPAAGTVNKTEFYGRPAGTVLFTHATPQLQKSPLGFGWEWKLKYNFIYDPHGWNTRYCFLLLASDWYNVSLSGIHYAHGSYPDNEGIYNERELNKLFNVRPTGT